MLTATIECYACEQPAGRTAVILQSIYDGDWIVLHRRCIVRIIAKCPEGLAEHLHFHFRPLFNLKTAKALGLTISPSLLELLAALDAFLAGAPPLRRAGWRYPRERS